MQNNYVSIATGRRYKGKIPETITIPVSDVDAKGYVITKEITARYGDENYQGVLDTWMFTHGYMKAPDENVVVLKGGAGSGHFGHKGRKGQEGGSLPKDNQNIEVKLPPSLSRGTSGKIQERNKERVRIMEEKFPGVKFSTASVNVSFVKNSQKLGMPGAGLPRAIYDQTVEPISKPEVIASIVEAQKKWGAPYTTFTALKFATGLSFQEVFGAFKYLKEQNPYSVSFTVDRQGENTAGIIYTDKVINVVLKGGPGSGHYDHRGIPGHQGGSLPRDAVSAGKKVKEPVVVGIADETEAERLRQELLNFAEEYGVPPEDIIFDNTTGNTFTVGKESYTSAANFNPKTGKITIFSDGMLLLDEGSSLHFQEGIIAHEVMHYRFSIFMKQFYRQRALAQQEYGVDAKGLLDIAQRFSFFKDALKTEGEAFNKKYWAVASAVKHFQSSADRDKLYKYPVSDYGASYIEVAKTATYGLAHTNAISENLSEVALDTTRYAKGSNVIGTGIFKGWVDLYNDVNSSLFEHGLIPKEPARLTRHASYEEELTRVFGGK